MYLEASELKTAIYQYQLAQITEGDTTITLQAIAAAVAEVRSYLTPNSKKDWMDGRPLYNADTEFAKTGSQRNALLLEITKTIAIWYLLRLCNADIMYENVKERYDRAIDWLKQLSRGDITLDLPRKTLAELEAEGGGEERAPFGFGSRTKFNHE